MKPYQRWSCQGISVILMCCIISCTEWNNPYVDDPKEAQILYASFSEQPKTLDPARAYSSDAYGFISQIYEPPLQYHYLKRPWSLIPLSVSAMPELIYLDEKYQTLPPGTPLSQVVYSRYRLTIKPGLRYQPHPAFARDASGQYIYHQLPIDYLETHQITRPVDFGQLATRLVTADDYVYQIKRMAHPEVHCPILGLMSKYIVGLSEFSYQLASEVIDGQPRAVYSDVINKSIRGVRVVDSHTFEIDLKGNYPQFIYWLAMPFFAPVPWEGDVFYAQEELLDANMTFDFYPIGSGPYQLTQNDPNHSIVLEKNPNFHGEYYPDEGMPGDEELLKLKGRLLPFVNKAVYSLEKEAIPRWGKFLQGYYDMSSISSDSFDEAIRIDERGQAQLTSHMKSQGIHLKASAEPSIFYMGFNMQDPLVGGNSERARLLRQAIAIAVDFEEYISIFLNGRGTVAHSPVPPSIWENDQSPYNFYVYHQVNGKIERRSIEEAKVLLAKAGYQEGLDPDTGQSLVINYDVTGGSDPNEKARLHWMIKQFDKLGLQLNLRATQYNRFQEKIRTGNVQFFSFGWNADYSDPENFLFLLYGPNGKVKHGGENSANYNSQAFNDLFEKMNYTHDAAKRNELIQAMVALLRYDAPWIFGYYPQRFTLLHSWYGAVKPNAIANNTLKYVSIDAKLRSNLRQTWNIPSLWPFIAITAVFLGLCLVLWGCYWRRERQPRYK